MKKQIEVTVIMSKLTYDSMQKWLLSRESDIDAEWEDLGELREFFKAMTGREPRDI